MLNKFLEFFLTFSEAQNLFFRTTFMNLSLTAMLLGSNSVKPGYKYLFLVKNALGKISGYFIKPSGHNDEQWSWDELSGD